MASSPSQQSGHHPADCTHILARENHELRAEVTRLREAGKVLMKEAACKTNVADHAQTAMEGLRQALTMIRDDAVDITAATHIAAVALQQGQERP